MSNDDPYLTETVTEDRMHYNPGYGDNRICVCGHPYYRHFDPYEDMEAVGCKYCGCHEFREAAGLLAQDPVPVSKIRERIARLKQIPIVGTLKHRGYAGKEEESVVVSKWWVDSFEEMVKLLLEDDGMKECPTCRGRGYQEWQTGCPECGKSPPCESEEECPGPDEMCRTCKGLGRVPK